MVSVRFSDVTMKKTLRDRTGQDAGVFILFFSSYSSVKTQLPGEHAWVQNRHKQARACAGQPVASAVKRRRKDRNPTLIANSAGISVWTAFQHLTDRSLISKQSDINIHQQLGEVRGEDVGLVWTRTKELGPKQKKKNKTMDGCIKKDQFGIFIKKK